MANVIMSGFEDVDKQLAQLPIQLRGKEMNNAMKQAAGVIADRARMMVPPPGYPGDKPGLKPLRDSLTPTAQSYATMTVARIKGQPHLHLVEGAYFKGGQWINIDVRHHSWGQPTKQVNAEGEPQNLILKKTPFVQTAEDQTKEQQLAAIRSGVTAAVKKATGQ